MRLGSEKKMPPLPFENNGYSLVFWIAVAIWGAFEWFGAAQRRAHGDAQVRDRGSRYVLMLGLGVGLALDSALPWIFPGATIGWHRTLLFATGIALILLGIALRGYAIHVLGRYFTRVVAVHPDQTVVQSGPYRYIRHPAYSGTLVTVFGVGLTMTNWASLVAIMVCALLGYTYRVAVEERALREKIGPPYVDYMRRTRRFIPFVF